MTMSISGPRALGKAICSLALLSAITVTTAGAALAAKDVGPADTVCDAHAKKSPGWRTCAATQAFDGSDAELFYAGYWLAKTGRYQEALVLLRKIRAPGSDALTYVGFATRKLGRTSEALTHYEAALAADPNNAVTRSYMGEALIELGRVPEARRELDRIASICGTSCEAYRDLRKALGAATAAK